MWLDQSASVNPCQRMMCRPLAGFQLERNLHESMTCHLLQFPHASWCMRAPRQVGSGCADQFGSMTVFGLLPRVWDAWCVFHFFAKLYGAVVRPWSQHVVSVLLFRLVCLVSVVV